MLSIQIDPKALGFHRQIDNIKLSFVAFDIWKYLKVLFWAKRAKTFWRKMKIRIFFKLAEKVVR